MSWRQGGNFLGIKPWNLSLGVFVFFSEDGEFSDITEIPWRNSSDEVFGSLFFCYWTCNSFLYEKLSPCPTFSICASPTPSKFLSETTPRARNIHNTCPEYLKIMREKTLIDQTWLVLWYKCFQWASFKTWINQLLHLAPKIPSKGVRSGSLCDHRKIQRAGSFEFSVLEERTLNRGARFWLFVVFVLLFVFFCFSFSIERRNITRRKLVTKSQHWDQLPDCKLV